MVKVHDVTRMKKVFDITHIKALLPSSDSDFKDSDPENTPFLEYSSLYWGIQAKRELLDCGKLLAIELFDNYNNHISILIILPCSLDCTVPPSSELLGL